MRQSALRSLEQYLAAFPDEAERQAALRAQLLEDPADVFARSNMRGHITASALVLNTDHSKLLLIHHRVINRWLQPGGHVESGQTLWDSACREVAEETGVTSLERVVLASLGDHPIDIDTHAIAANPRKCEAAHWHHDFLYLACADIRLPLAAQLSEVRGVRWAPLTWLIESQDARLSMVARKLQALA